MKAMIAAALAMSLISVLAWFGLEHAGFSTASQDSSASVRLDGE